MKTNYLSIFFLFPLFIFSQTSDLMFSKYGEGSSNNKFLEIYNGTGQDIDLSAYSVSSCSNGCDEDNQFDYPDNITFEPGTILLNGDVYVITHPSADPSIASDQTFTYLSNGNDAFALTAAGATASNYTIIDIIGDMLGDPGLGWEVAGISDGTKDHTLTRKSSICNPNPIPLASFGTNENDSEWIVTDQNAGWDTVGSFEGCIDGPVLTILSPFNNQEFDSGTTTVSVSLTVDNFTVGEVGSGSDGHIHWSINGQNQPMKYDVDNETIDVIDGENYSLYMELVDENHQPINPAVNQTINFSVIYPCDLIINAISSICDSNTSNETDTYTTTLEYTGGGTTNYTIDTGGVGTVSGDDPSTIAEGTIVISGVLENIDYVVSFIGDSNNSSCNFIRTINSPNCAPSLSLPYNDSFDYEDGPLISSSYWSNFSGEEGDLLVNTGQVLVQHGDPSEDAGLSFNAVDGVLYYAFDFSVNDPGEVISGNDSEYFAMFKDDGFNYRAKIDIVPANNEANDFTVGIASSGNFSDSVWPDDLYFETTYRATVKYDQSQNIAQLWINANSEADLSISGNDEDDPGTTITQFGLRQSDSSNNESILIDNLSISQTFSETLSNSQNLDLYFDIGLYPNPSSLGFVNILTNRDDIISADVYDISGKHLTSSVINNSILYLHNLKPGIYIVKVTQNEISKIKKLIIK